MSAALLQELATRASILWLALALTIAIGWPFGYALKLDRISRAIHILTRSLGRRLNKSKRDAATLAWRGVIVTAMVVCPAFLAGLLLDHSLSDHTRFIVPLLLFTASTRRPGMLALWRAAKNDALTLQMAQPNYLFTDTHALLRFIMLDHATRFAINIVGVIFWYLIGGAATAFAYLALALCAAHFTPELKQNLAFGGATDRLFALAHAIPRFIATALLLFASFFAPGAKPARAVLHFMNFPRFLADLLDIALGGPMPAAHGGANMPWVGSGTPRPEAKHLARWLITWAVALLLLLAVLLPCLIQLSH